MSLDGDAPDLPMDEHAAEKYIISLKLQKWLETLHIQRKELTARKLSGDDVDEQIAKVDTDIRDANERIEKLISM